MRIQEFIMCIVLQLRSVERSLKHKFQKRRKYAKNVVYSEEKV